MLALPRKACAIRRIGRRLGHLQTGRPAVPLSASYLSDSTAHARAELNKNGGNGDNKSKGIDKSSSETKGTDKSTSSSPEMYYRVLGNTGLQVSLFSYGYWTHEGDKDKEAVGKAKKCLSIARDAGINYFDNSNVYGSCGESERILGAALKELQEEDSYKWRRSDLLIGTKIFWNGEGVNEKGLSRKNIRCIDSQLERLQQEYVDLVYCHQPDALTPTETVVRAMTDIVRGGRATAWGTSDWSAQQITEAYWIAKQYGLEPPTVEQPHYHLLHRRRFETEFFPLYYGPYMLGTVVWSPLASGVLTGDCTDGSDHSSNLSRKDDHAGHPVAKERNAWIDHHLKKWHKQGKLEKLKEVEEFAKSQFDCSLSTFALAWCAKNKYVSTVLLGATEPDELKENLRALKVAEDLTCEDMCKIDEILDNKPAPYFGYGDYTNKRRPLRTLTGFRSTNQHEKDCRKK